MLARSVKRSFLKFNYLIGNYQKVIWLIGDGRSGTTWVTNLINHRKMYREMFEPFHPYLVEEMKNFVPHEYIRPGDPSVKNLKIASQVFSGKFLHDRVDRENDSFFYDGVLIKDVFANLCSYWAFQNFPHIKIVFLIRNPFAVALSKFKKKTWSWMTNPLDFLEQLDLHEDYLHPFEKLIKDVSNRGDYIQNQILIWSIINYIPLLQFGSKQIHVVFYENIFSDPNYEVAQIFNYVREEIVETIDIPPLVLRSPSRVTTEWRDFSKNEHLGSWKNELTTEQIDRGFEILSHFGFDQLYNDDLVPNISVIDDLLNKDTNCI